MLRQVLELRQHITTSQGTAIFLNPNSSEILSDKCKQVFQQYCVMATCQGILAKYSHRSQTSCKVLQRKPSLQWDISKSRIRILLVDDEFDITFTFKKGLEDNGFEVDSFNDPQIVMLARSRFNQFDECSILLSKIAPDTHQHKHAFYEWINPITEQHNGAFPFRTGISSIRLALFDIIYRNNL